MRVAQINGVCGSGSTGRIAVDISKMMEESGIDNVIYYGQGDSDFHRSKKIGSSLNIRYHQLASRITGKHGYYSKDATIQLIEELKDFDPDIVHLHNIHGFYLNIETLFQYLVIENKKVVWTLHDCWAFTGHCAYFDFVACEKWKTQCSLCPNKKEYPTSWLIDRSKLNYQDKKSLFNQNLDLTIVTPSNWLKGLLRESFLSRHKSITINNGIDLDIFKPTESNIRDRFNLDSKFMVLCIAANLEKRKGIDFIYQLAQKLDNSFQLVLLGAQESQLKNLPPNIIGLPKTNNLNELAELYTAADVYLNPTLEDNFPTTNLESLACGTPVITFKTGGSPESIDSLTGIVVSDKSVESLIKSLEEIKIRGKKSYESHCIDRANNHYNKKLKYKEYLNLYERL